MAMGLVKRYALKLTEKGEPPFNTTTVSKWEHLQYNTPSLPPLFPTWQQGIFSPFLFSRAPEKGGKWMRRTFLKDPFLKSRGFLCTYALMSYIMAFILRAMELTFGAIC